VTQIRPAVGSVDLVCCTYNRFDELTMSLPSLLREAASAAHLRALSITHRDYAQVMIRTLPREADGIGAQLRQIRRDYEVKFRRLIDDLPLPPEVDRHYLRLMLIGALNWSHVWYHSGGDRPEAVAHAFVQALRPVRENAS